MKKSLDPVVHIALDAKFLHFKQEALSPNTIVRLLKVHKDSSSVFTILEAICDILSKSYQLVDGLSSSSESSLVGVDSFCLFQPPIKPCVNHPFNDFADTTC